MLITEKTQLLGIIGNPIQHSLSPVIQNQAIATLNLDYIYLPFLVKEDDLSKAFDCFKAIKLRGFNVTIPHKKNVIPFLKKVTETAEIIEAVNVVWLTEEGWHGTNTDIDGFLASFKKLSKDWHNITPLILGNGGGGRAVTVGCSKLGCREIKIVGRNLYKLRAFQERWNNYSFATKISIYHWDNLSELIPDSELIINATPIGMSPHIKNSPLTDLQISLIKQNTIVYDLIYTPSPTLFLQQAQKQGAIIIDGSEMLIQQGAIAFEIWTGKSAPIDIMLNSMLSKS
ncbi:shikimate dehydrogenase [Geminocystis sp. GBBB08]|uniref:shikimate dehydrogenase n=1 Tax=Geminocystis sp. GBBB08 TaxID=2604140 RepID=UPI0027E2A0C6|nr:shikimate dehydrogenase [Geminocystis sp. GBBB08]MBL1210752.1 shikimate dehydrogenase [Geminocystis sp. GBBB08]